MVVVNTHLYGAHLASGGAVLPPHEVVVFDEAHEVEEVMTDSLGVEIGPGRFRALAASARPLLDAGTPGAVDAVDAVSDVAELLQRALRPLVGQQVARPAVQPAARAAGTARRSRPRSRTATSIRPDSSSDWPCLLPGPAGPAPRRSRSGRPVTPTSARCWPWPPAGWAALVDHLRQAEREAGDDEPASARSRRDRVLLAAGHLAADLARLAALTDDEVAWVDGGSRSPSLRISPIDVGPLLSEHLWGTVTGVLTSATVPLGLAERLGLPRREQRRPRRGKPLRLSPSRPAVRGPVPARPPAARVGARPPRRARDPHHRGRRAHPGPVHQLEGHERRRGGAARPTPVSACWPSRTCPSRRWSRRSGTTRPPACSPRSGSGRGWTSPGAPSAW